MKKLACITLMATALSMTSMVNAEQVTFNVAGEVTESTCSIPLEQLTRTIDIQELELSTLQSVGLGSSVASQNFEFDVTSCPPSVNGVGVRMDYLQDADNPQYMSNTGNAEGVLLAITKEDDSLVSTGSVINSSSYSAGTGTVRAKIHAYRMGNVVKTGNVASTATVTLVTN